MADKDENSDVVSITLKEILSSWEEKYLQWRRFARTRKAFLSGESLHSWSDDARTKLGFMTPWKFDLYESVLAAAPAIILLKIADFLVPPPSLVINPDESLYGRWLVPDSLAKPVADLVISVEQTLTPFWLPLSLMIVALITVKATLAKQDRSSEKNNIVRNAYFYFDGSHGLLPQTLFNIALMYLIILGVRGVEAPIVVIICLLIIFVFFAHEWWIQYKRIPRFLFSVAGYEDGKLRMWTLFRKKTDIEKRWYRYRRIIQFGGLLILFLNFFVLKVLIWSIAISLAFVQQLV